MKKFIREFRKYLKMLAPGSIFRIRKYFAGQHRGLVVVGDSPALMNLVSGGFT